MIEFILANYQVEKQAMKSVMALKRLAKKYSNVEIETACQMVLSYTTTPSVKNIQTILKENKLKEATQEVTNQLKSTESGHTFTRGATYYGGK